jgi:hypothetical protein
MFSSGKKEREEKKIEKKILTHCLIKGCSRLLLKPIRAMSLRECLFDIFKHRNNKLETIAADPHINQSHILVVDDTETNLLFAEHLLKKINPSAKVAQSIIK